MSDRFVVIRLETNLSDEDAQKRLREVHEFLNSKNINKPVSHIEPSGACHLSFEFGNKDEMVPVSAVLRSSGRKQYEFIIQCQDPKRSLTAVCRNLFNDSAKKIFQRTLGDVLKLGAEKRHTAKEPIASVSLPTTAGPTHMTEVAERAPQT
jgi:hypothetical protein